ncbi:hypothetical protein FRY74_12515 [Vicingus serpentipes]|uniref:Lipoprotein n=1 Tax=Vicingus serpentipes TaxID=1926625 RepID=A0A5C6RP05_9FLAO|nr:hypothetical protein [Vicingus serpentipes]TXB63689.1 hypothetical protein FRY74_12515 [Vicingus serpentipes]
MRLLFISILLISFCACKTNENGTKISVLKEYQKRGTVLSLPKKTTKGTVSDKEYYFRTDNINYFIKFSESYITALDLNKYVNQTIVIKGSIKNGLWEPKQPQAITSAKQPEKARSGPYITIERIYKNKK